MKRIDGETIGGIIIALVLVAFISFIFWICWNAFTAPNIVVDYYTYNGKFIKCTKTTTPGWNQQVKTTCTDH